MVKILASSEYRMYSPSANRFQGMENQLIHPITQENGDSLSRSRIEASTVFMTECRDLRPTSMSPGYSGVSSPSAFGLQSDAPSTLAFMLPGSTLSNG